ncbi:hypothetical protein E2542_SST16066 [Spatholobus suberectus]|nr:hypothetical protein E2542_SST16066 [Spatholobus suberectus]
MLVFHTEVDFQKSSNAKEPGSWVTGRVSFVEPPRWSRQPPRRELISVQSGTSATTVKVRTAVGVDAGHENGVDAPSRSWNLSQSVDPNDVAPPRRGSPLSAIVDALLTIAPHSVPLPSRRYNVSAPSQTLALISATMSLDVVSPLAPPPLLRRQAILVRLSAGGMPSANGGWGHYAEISRSLSMGWVICRLTSP